MSVTASTSSPVADQQQQQVPMGPVALAGAPRPAGAPKPKPRKRVNTAEKRHQHNAIERQRRETLNGKFLVLARLLPSLATCRRPSKSAIVNGSISHLSRQREQRLLASRLLRQMAAEREELIAEINHWRQANGCQAKPQAKWTDEMDEVCQVEKEKFGSFANVDENGDDNGDDDDESAPVETYETMSLEAASLVAGQYSTGLVTPRSSTDMSSTPSLPMNGFNWSGSFGAVGAPSLPFSGFVSDHSAEASPQPSPVGSSSHPTVLTPNSAVDPATATLYTHTPSPRSASPEAANASPTQWSPQQLAMFQQVQNQSLHPHQQAAFAAALANPAAANVFQQHATATHHQQQPHFSQLMDSMLNLEDWGKLALGGAAAGAQQQQSAHGSFTFGSLNNGWSEQAVGV